MPFIEKGYYQARQSRWDDDESWAVILISDEARSDDRAEVTGLKEWQANAIARIFNGERPRSWARRKDEKR